MAQVQSRWQRSFVSQADRKREEALCSHYRKIGIQAVAAAKCLRDKPQQAIRGDQANTASRPKKPA